MNPALLAAAGAILVAATAQPVLAADPATINCIRDALDTPTRQALLIQAQNTVQGKPDNELDATAMTLLVTKSGSCAKRFGWSDKARIASFLYTLIEGGVPVYEAGVRADGFDPAATEGVIRALPPELFAGLAQSPIPPAAETALAENLIRAKIAPKTEKQGFHIGVLAAAISSIETRKAEFAAS